MKKNIIVAVIASAMSLTVMAQHKTEVKSEFIGQSNMLDSDGNKVGERWFEKLSVNYTVPMKVRVDSLMRPTHPAARLLKSSVTTILNNKRKLYECTCI